MEPKRDYWFAIARADGVRRYGGVRSLDAAGVFTLIIADAAPHSRNAGVPIIQDEVRRGLPTGIVRSSILYVGLRHFSPGQFRSATQVASGISDEK